ncbi:MAG: hypothetical protein WC205_16850 [Opitutaceae bacterium]|jgi:hypothetical protein
MKLLTTLLLAVLLCGILTAQELDPNDAFAKKVRPAAGVATKLTPLYPRGTVLLSDLNGRQSLFEVLGIYQTGLKVKREDGEAFFLKWDDFNSANFKANNPVIAEISRVAPESPEVAALSGNAIMVTAAWPREYSSKDKSRTLTITLRLAAKSNRALVIVEPFRMTKYANAGISKALLLEPGKLVTIEIPFALGADAKLLGEWTVRVWNENKLIVTTESAHGVAQKINPSQKPGRVEWVPPNTE